MFTYDWLRPNTLSIHQVVRRAPTANSWHLVFRLFSVHKPSIEGRIDCVLLVNRSSGDIKSISARHAYIRCPPTTRAHTPALAIYVGMSVRPSEQSFRMDSMGLEAILLLIDSTGRILCYCEVPVGVYRAVLPQINLLHRQPD